MLNPTVDEVTQAIEAVVATSGANFVYIKHEDYEDGRLKCWYVWDDEPSCLVGKVLHRLGVSVIHLSEVEHSSVQSASLVLRRRNVIDLPERAVTALLGAQGFQDSDNCWGDALKVYHAYLEQ